MHLSGYLEMKNIVSAMEETRSEDQIKRALGFTPVERK